MQLTTEPAKTKSSTPSSSARPTLLPAVFINREGEPEKLVTSLSSDSARVDPIPFSDRGDSWLRPSLFDQPESAAMNRLRRALFETGQLIVTPKDGMTRICFAGIGDPEHLFVEALPRDEPVPVADFDFTGRLCGLTQAEAILRRVYQGESSEKLSMFLGNPSAVERRRSEAA